MASIWPHGLCVAARMLAAVDQVALLLQPWKNNVDLLPQPWKDGQCTLFTPYPLKVGCLAPGLIAA